jgi:hypothetical protein
MSNKSFKTEHVKRRYVADNSNDSNASKNVRSVETLKSRLSRGYEFRPIEHKAQNGFYQRNYSNLQSRLTYPNNSKYNANKSSNFGIFYSDYQVPEKKLFLDNNRNNESLKETKQNKAYKQRSKTKNIKKTNLKTDQTKLAQNENENESENENENLFTSTGNQLTNLVVVSSENQNTSSNNLILKIENKEENEKFWNLHGSLFNSELPRFQINKKQSKMYFCTKKTSKSNGDLRCYNEEKVSTVDIRDTKHSKNFNLTEIENNLLKLELNETKNTKSSKSNFQTKKNNCKQAKSNDDSFDFGNIDDFWEDDLNIYSNNANIDLFSDDFF